MRIERQSAQSVSILLNVDKARRVLDGLREHASELGEVGRELADALREAGVTPYEPPAHVRHEWP